MHEWDKTFLPGLYFLERGAEILSGKFTHQLCLISTEADNLCAYKHESAKRLIK